MATVRLKGVNRVSVTLADGRRVVYWYAWKGGPRLTGSPGSPEFIAGYHKAHAARKAPQGDTLGGLVDRFKASPEFSRLADSTKAEWSRWLDRIKLANIASLSYAALEIPRCRVALMAWRDTYADRPRTADYGAQVLSRVLGWSVGRGHLSINAMQGAETLHRSDRADKIWTPEEIAAFCAYASPEVGRALRLACATGLRRGDLVALDWRNVGATAIVLTTAKTMGVATIPLVAGAGAILGELKARAAGPVLLNTRGQPWTADGLETQIIKAKTKAGVRKRLHDARGTFATRLRHAGLTRDEIAATMGWEPDRVERILARYVDAEANVRRIADKLAENETATKTPKRAPKRSGRSDAK